MPYLCVCSWTPVSAATVRTPRPTLERRSYTKYFDDLVDDFGENMPDSWVTHHDDCHKHDIDPTKRTRPLIFLHSGIFSTKTAVFKDFRARGIVSRHVEDSTIRTWWLETFWHVKVKKWQPFAKCDKCTDFRNRLFTMTSEADKEDIRVIRAKHRDQVSLGRKRFALREAMSIEHPSQFLCVRLHRCYGQQEDKRSTVQGSYLIQVTFQLWGAPQDPADG